MVPEQSSRDAQLAADLKNEVASAMSADASLTPHAAMLKITKEMLANNPFVTPTGCPVNALPPEILAYIFLVGMEMQEEEEEYEDDNELDFDVDDEWSESEEDVDPGELDEVTMARLRSKGKVVQGADGIMDVDGEDSEEDEDEEAGLLPFQVLVSHVCRHWRQVAIETPVLWSKIDFNEGAPFEKSKIWIQRAKSGPLDISIDCSIPGDETDLDEDDDADADVDAIAPSSNGPHSVQPVTTESHGHQYAIEHMDCTHAPPPHSLLDLKNILDMIVPLVAQWRRFAVTASVYEYIHTITSRLSECPSAPMLEELELYHSDEVEEYDAFTPAEFKEPFLIFNGNAPKLRRAALCGVHLEWDSSLTLLSNLDHLELSYHAEDVRPSFDTFSQLIASSPKLRRLELLLSGPREEDWGTDIIEIPSLKDLILCYHQPSYAIALLKKLSVPNVHSLALDFDSEDYTEFVKQLAAPMPKTNKSILAGLVHIKISGLPCNRASAESMLGQLVGLNSFEITCPGDEEREIFMKLFPVKVTTGGSATPKQKIYCPNLHTIKTAGIDGSVVRALVEARSAAGVPIKRLAISDLDDVQERDEKWLRAHVEEFDFFEPSDSEEDIDDDDDDDDDDDEVDTLAMHLWDDDDDSMDEDANFL